MAELYKVLKNYKLGRYLVTNKSLKRGTLIFSDLPFAVGPKPDSPPVCLGCHKAWNGKYRCTRCCWPCCNAKCEQVSTHRDYECNIFVDYNVEFQDALKSQPCLQYECIMPLRMLLAKEQYPEKWIDQIEMMEDHNEDRKQCPSWEVDQINIVKYLRGACKLNERFSEQLIQKVCGILEVNAVEVPFLHGPNLRAIYPKIAIMSHNCVPSAVHTIVVENSNGYSEYKAQVWSAIDLEFGDKIEICYTNVLHSTIERRDFLKLSKFFECNCERCADPTEVGTEMSTLLCIKCEDGYVRAVSPLETETLWKCSRCNYYTTSSNIRQLLRVIYNEIALAEKFSMGPGGIETGEQLLHWLGNILHPQHSIFIMLQYNLLQLYGRIKGYEMENLPIELLQRKESLCRNVIRTLDIISPGQTRVKGMTLYELHSALLLSANMEYRNSTININEFQNKMLEVAQVLHESGEILSREDPTSDKGIIGRKALQQSDFTNLMTKIARKSFTDI